MGVVAGVAVAVVGVGIVVVAAVVVVVGAGRSAVEHGRATDTPAVVIHLYESEFAPAFWIKMDKAYVSI